MRQPPRLPRRRFPGQSYGAATLEFVLTFPAILLCIYLLVVYSLVFMVQQTITFAASEASRAAGVSISSVGPSFDRTTLARTRIDQILAALPSSIRAKIQPATIEPNLAPSVCGAAQLTQSAGFFCVRVSINYPFASNPAIILLPGMEKLVPKTLSASASALYEN